MDWDAARPDAVVIGSGFGGAVSACRLAESGRKVLVLERGPRRSGNQFPRLGMGLPQWLWTSNWNGFFDLRVFHRIATLTSSGVGGGSHAYANVHIRAPEASFKEGWPAGMGPETLAPYYARVERMLGVRPLPDSVKLEKTAAYAHAGQELHQEAFRPNLAVHFGENPSADPPPDAEYVRDPYGLGIDIEQAACRHCGECDIGCRFNAKNTLDLNYLAVAEQIHGAKVQELSEVLAISPSKGGYLVHYRDRASFQRHSLWTPLVVLAAGTVNTAELLLRCRDEFGVLPKLSPALGQHFSGNGDFLAAALNTKEPVQPWHGPVITVTYRHMGDGFHYYLQEGGFAPDLAFVVAAMRPRSDYLSKLTRGPVSYAARLRWFYQEVARLTGDSRALGEKLPGNTMIFLGMGQDGSDGRISLKKRLGRRPKLEIEWDHERTRPLISRMEDDLRRVTRELGGTYVTSPMWSLLGRLTTVHPLGGAAMADDACDGVLNPNGEAWNYPNLFVTDGAAIPRGLGPNPALTISANAERIAAQIALR